MKKLIVLIAVMSFGVLTAFSQAKKPTIMVVPSDIWCTHNGFITEFDNQGHVQKIPDYKSALQNNADIRVLLTKMGGIMAQREFPLKSLEQELKKIESQTAQMSLLTGKSTKGGISESPLDKLKRTANADILIDLAFEVKAVGPMKQVSFNIQAIDAYTSKIISGNTGVSSPSSSAPVELLLEEVVLSFMDNFTNDLQRHFDNMFAQGREIKVNFLKFDTSPIDFESEFDYKGQPAELADIISVWFEDNCVEGRFSLTDKSENQLKFEQVRMPLYGKSISGREVAIDAAAFVKSLQTMIQKEPYNTPVKIVPNGLGEVWLILGDK